MIIFSKSLYAMSMIGLVVGLYLVYAGGIWIEAGVILVIIGCFFFCAALISTFMLGFIIISRSHHYSRWHKHYYRFHNRH